MILLKVMAWMMVTEDGTCITVGLMINRGDLSWPVGLVCCYVGIVFGDFLLWAFGAFVARRMLDRPWMQRRLPPEKLDKYAVWFEKRGWAAVIAARFMPGTRFPVYVAAGMLGRRAWQFLVWASIAAIFWTPLLVGLAAIFGEPIRKPMEEYLGSGWLALLAAALVIWLTIRLISNLVTERGRARLIARTSKIWRWEFWPPWLAYLPLVPYVGYLALRYRGIMTPTVTDPGIEPYGGIVGESKIEILNKLPSEYVLAARLIPQGDIDERLKCFDDILAREAWDYPLIIKPDFGCRGASVRLVRDRGQARQSLTVDVPMMVQVFHPGPGELGVFYYRMPEEENGHILGITEKLFPEVVGDGLSSIEQLIYRHPRLRMQADTFLERLGADRAEHVLKTGERLPLVMAGNHCQGTLFHDGARFVTPEFTAKIDEIAKAFEGFYFGRFDLRFSDEDAVKAGREFAILELNGLSSESTNIYDPRWSILRSYGLLMKQWRIMFAIGAQNLRRGHKKAPMRDVWRHIRAHRKRWNVPALAD